jgi:hypothetical protein
MPRRWAIGVALGSGYILLFADKVMVAGPLFKRVRNSDAIISELLT